MVQSPHSLSDTSDHGSVIMQVTLKLFASLAPFMPEGAKDNAVGIEVDEGTTINQVFDRYQVPHKMAHLVLINGSYIAPPDRATRALAEGDALAAWPPVAGG
mgnify:CR=1 FL=1